ncbi:MAG: hypothetical protein AABZ94_02650 [Candidatus Eisenbacteria bacterium]
MPSPAASNTKTTIRARVKEFGVPPIHDGLVVGKRAPIGCAALRQCLKLLAPSAFEHIEIEDDVISDILVRHQILKRIPQETLIAFVVERIKPLMGDEEILHLDLEAEVILEEERR